MPFVAHTEARNARLTRVPMEAPAPRDTLQRVPLVASGSMRLVLIEMPADYRTIPHRHPGAIELFYVLSGSGTFTIGDGGPATVSPGDLLLADVDEVHAIEAGPAGLRFLAGVAPNEDRPDEEVEVVSGDVVPR